MTQDTKREALIVKLLGDIAMWSGNDKLIQSAFDLAQAAALSTHPTPTAEQGGEDLEWIKLAFITGFEQAIHNRSLTAEEYFAEWAHAGFPGPPVTLTKSNGDPA